MQRCVCVCDPATTLMGHCVHTTFRKHRGCPSLIALYLLNSLLFVQEKTRLEESSLNVVATEIHLYGQRAVLGLVALYRHS